MPNKSYSIFKSTTPGHDAYGVRYPGGGALYEADFRKEVAERIVELENSPQPPKDWEATQEILQREGYDVSVVPAPKSLGSEQAAPMFSTLTMGAYKLDVAIDWDGHLTVLVKSTDGSKVVDIEDEVGCSPDELGFRFTTEKIEAEAR